MWTLNAANLIAGSAVTPGKLPSGKARRAAMGACNEFPLATGKALKAFSIGSLAARRPSTPRNVEPGAEKIAARNEGRDAGCGAAEKAHDACQTCTQYVLWGVLRWRQAAGHTLSRHLSSAAAKARAYHLERVPGLGLV